MNITKEMLRGMMETMIEDIKKTLPEDVVADIEELSRLQAGVVKCAMSNRIIDTSHVKKINALLKKLYDKELGPAVEKVFDFGEAIRRMKNGARVARKGWNGKGMFVMHCSVDGKDYTLSDGMAVTRRDYLYMKAADNTVVPWVASQTDILAEDWYEVKKEDANDA